MSRSFLSIATLLTMFFTTVSAQAASHAEKEGKKKILVLTFSGGFVHSSLAIAEEVMKNLGETSGVYEATCLGLYKDRGDLDLSFISADYLSDFDAVFLYTTTGDKEPTLLTDEQKQAFVEYIKSGRGAYIGSHSASDTFYNWPEYGEMVGAYFAGHPWNAGDPPVTIKVEDSKHPATEMLENPWVIQDEIYQFKPGSFSRQRSHVLLSLDTSKTDMEKGDRLAHGKDGDYPVAWCHHYGEGRCFYTSLGHRVEVWADPVFQKHLLGGIKWALGLAEGDATPSKEAE
jgi:hypothetical protein